MLSQPTVTRAEARLGGATLSYLAAGDPAQPWVVLLHGIPASAELWRSLLPRLAASGHYAVAPDLPGYGHTRVPTCAGLGLVGAARLLAQWLARASPGPFTLVGHDLGGAVAQVYLTQCKPQPQSVVLINCPVAASWPVPAVAKLMAAAHKGLYAPLAALGAFKAQRLRVGLHRAFVNPERLTPDAFGRVFYDGKFHRWGAARRFQAMLRQLTPADTLQAWEALPTVTTPVHLVWGMADTYQPWATTGARLQAHLPNVQPVHPLPDCGHFVPLDAPEALAQVLGAILATHPTHAARGLPA
ncbi:MAG: alpha/beta hydrolase [Bacteroidia bacterium]|nr:alpha/beta hydrolase [Bacteroidia bacterium]